MADLTLIGLIITTTVAGISVMINVFGNSMCSGIPFTLLKAKLKNKLVVEVENKDRSIDYIVPDIKEGYLQLQEWDIGQVLVTPNKVLDVGVGVVDDGKHHIDPKKVKVTKSGIRMIRVSSDLPEGFTAEDVKHGFIDSPQLIDRFNERIADKLAKEKEQQKPESKFGTMTMYAAIIIAVGVAGWLLISKATEWDQTATCMTALANCKTGVTATLPIIAQTITENLTQSGIY